MLPLNVQSVNFSSTFAARQEPGIRCSVPRGGALSSVVLLLSCEQLVVAGVVQERRAPYSAITKFVKKNPLDPILRSRDRETRSRNESLKYCRLIALTHKKSPCVFAEGFRQS